MSKQNTILSYSEKLLIKKPIQFNQSIEQEIKKIVDRVSSESQKV